MKKKIILLPFIAVLAYVVLSSYSGGPGLSSYERTGASGTAGCGTIGSGCHSDAATSANTMTIQILNGVTPVTTYVGGQSLTIRVTGNNGGSTTLSHFGFQLSAVLGVTTTNAGTLSATTGVTHTVTAAGINLVEHSAPIAALTAGGAPGATYVIDVPWTAPIAGSGSVSLRSVMNLVNHNSVPDVGDLWNTKLQTIAELAPITGPSSVCVGSTITLSDAFGPAGTWSSPSSNVTVNLITGGVTGNTVGTATITFTGGGNTVTKVVSVNANPGSFSGPINVCQTQTITMTNSVGGGTWSSASGNVSVTGAGASGSITGVNAGTALITYAIGTCSATATVTINPLAANTGTLSVCEGATTSLNNPNTGGTWSSSVPSVGTVSTSGVVSGLLAGTTNITYALSTGCNAVSTVTVNAQPSAIGGPTSLCISSTVNPTVTPITGGVWSSSTAGPGSVSIDPSTGVILPNVSGTTTITYTAPGGCFSTELVTVNPLPGPIFGGFTPVCTGSTLSLTSTPTTGTWLSGNTSIATVSSTGTVTGVSTSGGTVSISYTLSTGCRRVQNVTVNGLSPISGSLNVCTGLTTALSSGPAGGTWASSTAGVGTVSTSGVVTGISGGTTTVSYTTTTSCIATAVVTVGALSPITGGGAVCVGSTLSLNDAATGGTWSSGTPGVGTINSSSGLFTAIGTGTTSVTYSTGSGCSTSTVVTVNPAPGAVTASGGGTFCNSTTITASGGAGGTIYFQGTTPLGTSIATPSTSQLVTASGTYYFRVQSSTGCWGSDAPVSVTINPSPTAITGTTTVCVGATTSLNSTPAGGTWSSSDPTKGTVAAGTGVVTGIAAGTTNISYTITATGCSTSTVVTVNPLPADFTPAPLCVGATSTLSTTPTGGTWISGTPAVASIGLSSGLVTALTAGTTNITYTISSTGCSLVKVQTINANPTAITGPTTVCVGATTTLNSTPASGTWSSSDPSKGTVASGTGVVTGIAAGTTSVSYTITATGCSTNTVVTVNPLPTAITGVLTVCQGATTTLNSTPSTGTWSSGAISFATVGSSSGIVTGVAGGTAAITYMLATGCTNSAVVTVNPLPGPISGGNVAICSGATVSLTATPTGGTWSSTSSSVTVIGSSGVVTGASAGVAVVTYTVGTGCFTTTTITVNALPGAITGALSVCQGFNTNLSSTPTTGTWSSSATAFATVGSGTGIVNGVSPGTSTISYTLSTGCARSVVVSVNPNPVAITGTASTCVGTTTTLATTSTGGTWTSSSNAIATVGSASGIVTGVSVNTVTISYTFSTGCFAVDVVTVNPAPSAGTILGSSSVCTGLTITLTDGVTGGTWTASNGNATVSTSGVVTGVSAGTTTITYTVATPCGTVFTTKDISITTSATAGTISGPLAVCFGSSTNLSSSVTGGTWVSGNPSVASIGFSSGTVTGAGAGTANITYTIVSGCGTASTTATVTVNALPAASGGTPLVCVGATTTLTNVAGTWASSNTAVASVGSSSGIVTGNSAATAIITFTQNLTGCSINTTVTVNPLPNAIGGTLAICQGTSTTLTETSTGGTWSSSNLSVALIGSGSGTITTIGPGTSTISYTFTLTGCVRTAVFTVNPNPASITGTTSVCIGATTTLGNTSTGGTWSSGNTAVATIDVSSALVTGMGTGTSIITYTLSTGCKRTTIVSVNALPNTIGGASIVCVGSTTPLTNTTTGGTWSTSDGAIATIGSTSGIVSGVATGVATITYTATNGCFRTAGMTVNPVPSGITGTFSVCEGATTTLNDVPTGGNWISGNTAVATVTSSTGVVTGVAPGTALITYTLLTGCISTAVVTVNALPSVFSGISTVCAGNTITLGSTPTGGTWVSGTTANATIGSSTGIVSGIAAGTSIITYMAPVTGCIRAGTVTVNPLPTGITGTASVCVSSVTTLSGAPTGGTWTSGTTANATIGSSSGIVTGVAAGTSLITYTLSTGCSITTVATVNPIPSITGLGSVCPSATITLTGSITGGTWSSSSVSVASVGSSSGIVTGGTAGTTIITYTLGTGCSSAVVITVNPAPYAGAITGPSTVCAGANVTLFNIIPGGVWSETDGKTTVSTAGVITGVASGVDTIMYTVTTICGIAFTAHIMTINPVPVPGTITGTTTVCVGTTTTLSDAVTGGSWSSSNAVIASVGSGSGVVTGGATGSATITYTVTDGCGTVHATTVVTVLPFVSAGTISGPDSVCQGDTITLTGTGTGGAWSSTAVAIATVNTTGDVIGVAPGTVTIRYIVSNTCSHDTATHVVAVRSTADCTVGVDPVPVINPVALKVYPNPNNGSFTVELPLANDRITITILDVMGKVIDTRIIDDRTIRSAIFNLNNPVPGNYMVKINAGEQVYRTKFVILVN